MSLYTGKSNLLLAGAKSMKNHIAEFCSNTSIHGVKYLAERNRPFAEKLWWATIFITCVVGNAFLIQKAWIKWHESPVIVAFNERTMPVWSIPFPAVTICSEQKSKPSVFNYSQAYLNYWNNTSSDTRLQDLSLLCEDSLGVGNNITNNSTLDFLLEVVPSREMVALCTWKNTHDCQKLFSQIITEDGFCFSFNMLNTQDLFRDHGIPYYFEHHGNIENTRTDWTLENGYPPSSKVDKSYPFRAVGAGSKSELKIMLLANTKNNDYLCRLAEGFKILLHNPAEIPGMKDLYSRVPLNSETVIAVKPNVMTTNKNLKPYSPDIRQCYFPSERYLAHFKVYTQKNCELECLTNFTLKTCGCVAIHMPRDETTAICGRKDCYYQANDILLDIETAGDGDQKESSCNCLPSCISIEYDGEFSATDFDVEKLHKSMDKKLSFFEDGVCLSRISIFFKQPQFTTIIRAELYGLVDFLANCGGLLGLFLGISLLSFVEIFYYATLRCFVNFIAGKKKKKERK